MKKYFYDLHIHSCLSPCGDDASTPDSIAGMGELNGLDVMALTDHNTCKNCPAFFEACHKHGILPIAGMELTTAEDIHAVCLFGNLEAALEFDREIQSKRILIPNRVDIFGRQLICDSEDNIISEEEYMLTNATSISLDEALPLAKAFGGICYPAHIDRSANGVISVLGVFPKESGFTCAELHNGLLVDDFIPLADIPRERFVISSDAHYLWDIAEKENYFMLNDIPEKCDNAGEYFIEYLKGNI